MYYPFTPKPPKPPKPLKRGQKRVIFGLPKSLKTLTNGPKNRFLPVFWTFSDPFSDTLFQVTPKLDPLAQIRQPRTQEGPKTHKPPKTVKKGVRKWSKKGRFWVLTLRQYCLEDCLEDWKPWFWTLFGPLSGPPLPGPAKPPQIWYI